MRSCFVPRRFLGFAVAALTSAFAAFAADWQPIFSGKDLTGWAPVHDVKFEAKDGVLKLVRGTGWLRTEKEYGDFLLEVELRPLVERYDSGLFFRVGLDGKPWPTDGWQINLRRDMWGALVKGYTKILPSPVEGPDIDDDATPWTKLHLEVRGTKASLDLDGKRIWATDKIDRAKGYLGIQAEERVFEFRNFRVRELAAGE